VLQWRLSPADRRRLRSGALLRVRLVKHERGTHPERSGYTVAAHSTRQQA
jgi:hypothetical protein